jgi:hypothetical protein
MIYNLNVYENLSKEFTMKKEFIFVILLSALLITLVFFTTMPGRKRAEEKKTETYKDYKSETVGDVNLEIEVDNMLKSGRGTTIDELLKGFDYGLN